jgi:hypothetical protein
MADAPQETEEKKGGCCGYTDPDATTKKDIFSSEDENAHPILDNPGRRSLSLCCCLGTDWPALLIFMAVMGGCFLLWVLALTKGQVDIAINGMAWNGVICGKGAAANASYNVYINPTVTSTPWATSVCMPECPVVNASGVAPANDTKTLDALKTATAGIASASERAKAEADLSTISGRVKDLKKEVNYMSGLIGDTASELDRSTIYCLCNSIKYPNFTNFKTSKYDIKPLCAAEPAHTYGYIELAYDDDLVEWLGDGKNLALDPNAMDEVPCAFRYRTQRTFTRCMPWVSANSLGRITMVQGTSGISDSVSSLFNAGSQRIVAWTTDIQKAAKIMYVTCAVAFIMSIGLIYFMSCSCFDGCCRILDWLVWGVLISLLLIFAALTAITAYQFKFYRDRYETTPELSTHKEDEQAMYIYGISAAVAGLCFLCHLIFISPCVCGTQIQNSIEIIAAAAQAFQGAWALLFYPILHNAAISIAIVCWLIGLLFISTAGDVTTNDKGVHVLTYDDNFQKALMFYVVCIVWIVEFMGAVGFMIIAGAILVDFFQAGKAAANKPKRWPLMSSAGMVLCNHLGTAAIGSFLITLVVVIRAVVTYLLEEAKQKDQSQVLKYVAACIECCCECIEECMRYMVKTAYILTVLEGRWFFSAVCGGLWTLLSNAGQVFATNYIAYAILWLCKLAVPLGATALGYFLLETGKLGCSKYDLSSTFNVLVPIFLISCIFSFTFLGLLGISIEVVLIAFLKCEEMADAHPEFNVLDLIPENIAEQYSNFKERRQAGEDEKAKGEGSGEGEPLKGDVEKGGE